MTKGYQLKSAWAFKRGCRSSPIELLDLKEPRQPASNNQIWTDWWFESIGGPQQYYQTLGENLSLNDIIRKGVNISKSETFSITDYVITSGIIVKALAESLHISDFISTSLSGGQYFGILKRWSGAAWLSEPLKTYLGGWQTKTLKRWNGTNWVEINIGG